MSYEGRVVQGIEFFLSRQAALQSEPRRPVPTSCCKVRAALPSPAVLSSCFKIWGPARLYCRASPEHKLHQNEGCTAEPSRPNLLLQNLGSNEPRALIKMRAALWNPAVPTSCFKIWGPAHLHCRASPDGAETRVQCWLGALTQVQVWKVLLLCF